MGEIATAEHVEREHCRPGDWIEVDTPGGASPRRGLILEVLGRPSHAHYRVRWDEEHESLLYPAEGARFTRPRHRARKRRS